MDASGSRKSTAALVLGAIAVVLGLVVVVLDWRRGRGVDATGLVVLAVGLLVLVQARRPGRSP